MKTLYGWQDLRQYGIEILTGDADAHAQGVLCDLSEKGTEHIRRFFSLDVNAKFQDNWNSWVGEEEAVASILLPYEIFDSLCTFLLVSSGFHVVVKQGHSTCGFLKAEWEAVKEYHENDVVMYRSREQAPSPNLTNIHAMSGRTM